MTNAKAAKFGFASNPELIRGAGNTVKLTPGYRLGFTKCFACNCMCALRYRVDEKTGNVTRVIGNPYCDVMTAGRPLPLKEHLDKAYCHLAENNHSTFRASVCGRGASSVGMLTNPNRITKVLKRVGKRGENRWKTISYEQAVREIVEGGNLFNEGHVEGLRAIRDTRTLIDPRQPEFGTKSNQLIVAFNEEDTMRGAFLTRFVKQAYGSVNALTKHGYCGNAPAIGYSAGLAPSITAGLCEPDWENFEYAIFIGASPSNSGLSLNRWGSALASARTERKVEYVVVDPILRSSTAQSTGARWCPILPGTDASFLYGLIKVIFDNGWENSDFLSIPNKTAAVKAGEVNWSNASHLVVLTDGRPDTLAMADAEVFGIGQKGSNVVSVAGKLTNANTADSADLYVDIEARDNKGQKVRLVSSAKLLRDEANKYSLAQYSEQCGVPVADIQEIARKFTEHGRKAAVVRVGGMFSNNAAMAGWLCCILNTLIGSHDAKGGAMYSGGSFLGFDGAYKLATFDGAVNQTDQMTLVRNGPYEASSEYKNHIKKGENPYPSKHIFHPMFSGYAANNAAEMITAAINGDPYRAKALITWRSNVVYSAPSFEKQAAQALADPKVIPLFVSIDAFLNETNQLADYIIPDTVAFEDWSCHRTWGNFYPWVSAGAPAVEKHTMKNAKGINVCMEQFFIDCALSLKLPGFGKGAIPTKDGRRCDLFTAEDWHPRYIANVALQLKNLPEVNQKDRELAGLERAMKMVSPKVTKAEACMIEALFSRGGYYEPRHRYQGEFMNGGGGKFLQLFNPAMSAIRHAYSGQRYPGVPLVHAPRFFNGEPWDGRWPKKEFPLLLTTYKAQLRSPYSVIFERNRETAPQNFIQMHEDTAAQYGLKSGDRVRIISGNGVPAEGLLLADKSVVKGAVCVAHGFGHWAYGATETEINGKKLGILKKVSGGIAINRVIPHDPTRQGKVSMLNDYWIGATCRSGVPVKVEKLS